MLGTIERRNTTAALHAVATYGRRAGSARVRLFDWVDKLDLDAAEVTFTDGASVSPRAMLSDPSAVLRAEVRLRQIYRQRPRRLFLSRRASPFGRGRLESKLLKSATHSVYDFDDALWLSDRGPFALETTWRRSVEAADIEIAGNLLLAEAARQFSANVVMIPSCVDPSAYALKADYEIHSPVAGWIGSPSTEKYLRDIEKPLLQLHDEAGLRLKVISAGNADMGALNVMVDRVDWKPDTFAAELAATDFGIMPLDDTEWSRGKCAYKLLQYGAAGQVTVASPVGANRRALERLAGFAASEDHEWYDVMKRVISMTADERSVLGQRARAGVVAHYSFDAWRSAWTAAVLPDIKI